MATLISALIEEALELARGPDLSAPAFYYLKQALRDIAKNQMGPVMPWRVEISQEVLADTPYFTLPDDFCRAISARVDGESTVLAARHPVAFYQEGWPESNESTPTQIAFEDSRAMLNGTFAEATDVVLIYQKFPVTPAATSEESPLPAKWDDVLIARMVFLMFLDQRDQMAQKWEETYALRLGELLKLSHIPQMAATFKKTMVLER